MTWYANQILAQPEPKVRAMLAETFPGAGYDLRNLAKGVPDQGLLVVRELCGLGTRQANWFGDDGVSWLLPESAGDEPILAPSLLWRGVNEWVVRHAPPVSLLTFLYRLSRSASTVVSFYGAATWGGEWDYAYAWVFDGDSGADKVYVRDPNAEVRIFDFLQHPESPERPVMTVRDGDVLTLTLGHLGARLDGGYFEPHTRSFNWEPWREPAQAT